MIRVVSYGSGNVKAIVNIYKRLNIACEVATRPEDLNEATKIILPGVGAFDQTMLQLENSGLGASLNNLVLERKVPILGICVGMQIMARESEEGTKKGLGWVDGVVKAVDVSGLSHKPRLPHMGWNSISIKRANPILAGIDPERGFYFLHSYCFSCRSEDDILTTTNYGEEFSSAIHSGNIFGVQFHPEKSHQNGINLFRNFASL